MPHKTQYKAINIENSPESKGTCIQRILNQIPKGKAIMLTNPDLNLLPNQRTMVAKLIDPKDIPPPHNKKRK